jgi:sigma-B regulation protein RsbU (phosphoserine phosphatase)
MWRRQDIELQTFYKPFREAGGDYCKVIYIPDNKTLLALADVAGKGMAAALLAASIRLWLGVSPALTAAR